MGDIYIQLKKQHLIILGCIIGIFGVVLVSNAYDLQGSTDPKSMGHSANELDVSFGGSTQSLQEVFNSITDDSGNIDYANSAGAVDWNDISNKPDVATENWVEDKGYATKSYVDENSGVDYYPSDKHSKTGDSSFTNNNDYPVFVTVWGGTLSGVNQCALKAYVDGRIAAKNVNHNTNWNKQCFISFFVPSGTSWEINSDPYDNEGKGEYVIRIWE